MWMLFSLSLILFLSFGRCGSAAESTSGTLKRDSLNYLQDLRTTNSKRLKEIEESLRKSVEFADDNMVDEITTLKARQQEHRLRQEFLDRLINQIAANFSGDDLRAFLAPALKEMAKVDAINTDSGLYVFLRYASEAVAKLPEPRENVLVFLEGYMNQSIAHPMTVKAYLATRNYTNGLQSEAGHPMDRGEVGAVVDERLHAIKSQRSDAKPVEALHSNL